MYTIGQVSAMFNLPVSTLRYYDKEGFFPNLERKGNIRYFSDNELEALRIIECLKKSGLEIKDIKQFFIWVSEGSSSYEKRKELFETRKSAVETEIQELQKTLSLLKFKCCQLFDIILFLLFFLLPLCTSSCKKQCHMLKYRTCPHRAEPHHTSSP